MYTISVFLYCDLMLCCDIMASMRTTITLDRDVSTKIKLMIQKTNKSFKQLCNELLRSALSQRTSPEKTTELVLPVFKGKTGFMPGFTPGMTASEMAGKLDEMESTNTKHSR